MRTLLSERFAPITSSIGFLELPLEEVAAGLEQWTRSLDKTVRVQRPSEGFPEVLHRLEPLTGGAVPRELLVDAGRWTAYFDNSLRGTDASPVVGHLAEQLGCPGVVIDDQPHTVGLPGIRDGRYGSVQFELFGPLQTDWLNQVRAVAAAYDGDRWRFNAVGTVQPFEEVEAYGARRVRDRFTSEMLERYCKALGIEVFDPNFYGPEAVFFEVDVTVPKEGLVLSLADAQAWLEIIPGMADTLPG